MVKSNCLLALPQPHSNMKMLVSLQGMNESCNGPSLNDMDNVHFFFFFFFNRNEITVTLAIRQLYCD